MKRSVISEIQKFLDGNPVIIDFEKRVTPSQRTRRRSQRRSTTGDPVVGWVEHEPG